MSTNPKLHTKAAAPRAETSPVKKSGAKKHDENDYILPLSSGLAKMWFNEEEDKAWDEEWKRFQSR